MNETDSLIQRLWDFLKSLKLTATILPLIIFSSMIGTFVAQRPQINAPMEKFYDPIVIRIFDFFNFFDLYHSWWFTILLFLFFLNLLICTIDRIPKVISLFNYDFSQIPLRLLLNSSNKSQFLFTEPEVAINVIKLISPKTKRVSYNNSPNEERYYFNKGRFGRFNFLWVHAGLLVTIIGCIIGASYGLDGTITLEKNQSENTVLLPRARKGPIKTPLGFAIKLTDFRIEFYKDQQKVKQYYATLEVLESGKVVKKEIISVNHPLEYKGVNVYYFSHNSNLRSEFTVFQVSKNPGITIIWIGFSLLCIGLFLVSFFAHTRYYFILDKTHNILHVIYTKDNLQFTLENSFQKITTSLEKVSGLTRQKGS